MNEDKKRKIQGSFLAKEKLKCPYLDGSFLVKRLKTQRSRWCFWKKKKITWQNLCGDDESEFLSISLWNSHLKKKKCNFVPEETRISHQRALSPQNVPLPLDPLDKYFWAKIQLMNAKTLRICCQNGAQVITGVNSVFCSRISRKRRGLRASCCLVGT